MRRAALARLAVALTLTSACAELIGIEDASVDPRLVEGATGGTPNAGGGRADASPGGGHHSSGGRTESASGGAATAGADSGEGGAAGAEPGHAGAGGEGGSPEASVCERYCEQIGAYCTGELEQYRDRAQCLKICAYLPEGELGDPDANTAACRLKYAGWARYASGTELAAYCRQAGPGGDGRCGSNCEGYCAIMMSVCTEDSADVYHYRDEPACLEACAALPLAEVPYSTSDPLVSDGNHVQCRLFHVTSAAMLDTEEHCEHAVGVTLCAALAGNE